MQPTPLVITAAEVAGLLHCGEATFRAKRRDLERDHGFPPKLPGCNGWSKPAVRRWIETNGGSFLPAGDAGHQTISGDAGGQTVIGEAAEALAQEYAGGRS